VALTDESGSLMTLMQSWRLGVVAGEDTVRTTVLDGAHAATGADLTRRFGAAVR
jgi:hypothetical protein